MKFSIAIGAAAFSTLILAAGDARSDVVSGETLFGCYRLGAGLMFALREDVPLDEMLDRMEKEPSGQRALAGLARIADDNADLYQSGFSVESINLRIANSVLEDGFPAELARSMSSCNERFMQ